MAESERESFLAKFTNGTGSVGLVVLGESLPKASTFHVNSS
jgi:hypothetical protein